MGLAHQKDVATGRRPCDVAIIGAGPYGLAAAAYLRSAGADIAIFGECMEFWKRSMPAGMLLRSPWEASTIADPGRLLTLDRFEDEQPHPLLRPLPLEDFVRYGEWFAERVVPDLDARRVTLVEAAGSGFDLTLEDEQSLRAKRVVVAAGLAAFGRYPDEVAALPDEVVSHASDPGDFARFERQRVLVIGGGQSAIESAALLHEAGADVEVVVRAPAVHWLNRSALLHRVSVARRLLYAPSDVGPPAVSWVIHAPRAFRCFPLRAQRWMAQRSLRPAASAWLAPRAEPIRISLDHRVTAADMSDQGVRVELDDGSRRVVDHVLLGTGYRVDITRYSFLAPKLLRAIAIEDGFPLLGPGLVSSVPGLHFVGAPAARSFGPLMRFVAGTSSVGRALTPALTARAHRIGSRGAGRRHGNL